MSVALLIRDTADAQQRLVPVAAQQTFVATWLPSAIALGLAWVPLAETGFDVTSDNRTAVVVELEQLRACLPAYDVERLDRLVAELRALRFDAGATAFLG